MEELRRCTEDKTTLRLQCLGCVCRTPAVGIFRSERLEESPDVAAVKKETKRKGRNPEAGEAAGEMSGDCTRLQNSRGS